MQQFRRETAVQTLVNRPIRQELAGQVLEYGDVSALLGVAVLDLELEFEQTIQAAH